jgi:hypothetical protein
LADEADLANDEAVYDDGMFGDMFNDPSNDDLTPMDPDVDGQADATGDGNPAADDSPADAAQADDSQADATQADETQQQQDEPQQDETQADEGSGGGDGGFFSGFPSFSFPSFFRSFSGRQGRSRSESRQIYSPCTDRITLPCIVEDFLGAGMGDIPTCIPVHCGNSLCQAGVSSCKIETSVTPFHIGVHFGDGKASKGSPEDNIGACLRYKQLPCS